MDNVIRKVPWGDQACRRLPRRTGTAVSPDMTRRTEVSPQMTGRTVKLSRDMTRRTAVVSPDMTGRTAEAEIVRLAPVIPLRPRNTTSSANGRVALILLHAAPIPVFVAFLLHPNPDLRTAALAIFVLASLANLLATTRRVERGARTCGKSLAGSIVSKALTASALVGLTVLGELVWPVTAIILLREIGITLLRSGLITQVVIPSNFDGRLKSFLRFTAIVAFLTPDAPEPLRWILMGLALGSTVTSAIAHIRSAFPARTLASSPR
jgi:CDP-diacylglycerol--glycerol-3-phosphate 3-phosphatidyltransferase